MHWIARYFAALAGIGTTLGAHAQSTTDELAAITRHFEKYTSLMDAG
jgi:hypothetical protein